MMGKFEHENQHPYPLVKDSKLYKREIESLVFIEFDAVQDPLQAYLT
jgi:hypothetical protein